ncbi:MAG: hypothetical protein GC162_17730 [Planctomycetes bacterium]|nr:hypothetical protein [Planctomycetota bacterium]
MRNRHHLWSRSVRFRLALCWLLAIAAMASSYYEARFVAYPLYGLALMVRWMDSPVPRHPKTVEWIFTAVFLLALVVLLLLANRLVSERAAWIIVGVLLSAALIEAIRRDALLFWRGP